MSTVSLENVCSLVKPQTLSACPHHVQTRSLADTGAQQISVRGKDAELVPTACSPSRTPQKAGLPARLQRPPPTPTGPPDPAEGMHAPATPILPSVTKRKRASLWLPACKPGCGPLRIQQFLNYTLFHTLGGSRTRVCRHSLSTRDAGSSSVAATARRATWQLILPLPQRAV